MRAMLIVVTLLTAAFLPVVPAAGSCVPSGQTNDCVDTPIEWFGATGTYSNAGATTEPGEPVACEGATVTGSVWFTVEVVSPGSSDWLGVELDAPFYATLGLYERDGLGNLVLLDCNTSWEDEGLHSPTTFAPCTPGKVYHIQVGSMNGGPRGSFELSEFSSFWHDECWFKPTLPTEPRLYAPVGGNGRIDLSWVEPWWDGGRSVSVSHYKVYRASTCAGPFALAATTPNRFWSDTGLAAGESRCYQVTAVNSVGEGPAEPGRSATTWTAPRPPAALSVTRGGDGELRVTWTPSPDHAGPGPVLAYRLYRATSASGPFSLIAIPGASATTYLDTGLGKGATRHYRIAAVNGVGEGAPSATRAGTTWQLPGIPLNVQATAQIGLQPVQVQVTWEAPAEGNDLTLYRIYYATSPTAEPRLIGEVHHAQRSFVDALQTPLFDHHYEVRAFNPAGEGAPSARTCVVWPTSTPLGRC